MKFGPDTTGLKPVQINKLTKTLFYLAFAIDLIVDVFTRPPSTGRGICAGLFAFYILMEITLIWARKPRSNDDDDDRDDDDNMTPSDWSPTPPGRPRSAHDTQASGKLKSVRL